MVNQAGELQSVLKTERLTQKSLPIASITELHKYAIRLHICAVRAIILFSEIKDARLGLLHTYNTGASGVNV